MKLVCKLGIHKFKPSPTISIRTEVIDYIVRFLKENGFVYIESGNYMHYEKNIKIYSNSYIEKYDNLYYIENSIRGITLRCAPYIKVCSHCGFVKSNLREAKEKAKKITKQVIEEKYQAACKQKEIDHIAKLYINNINNSM